MGSSVITGIRKTCFLCIHVFLSYMCNSNFAALLLIRKVYPVNWSLHWFFFWLLYGRQGCEFQQWEELLLRSTWLLIDEPWRWHVANLWWHWWTRSWQRILPKTNCSRTRTAGSAGAQSLWGMEVLSAHSTCETEHTRLTNASASVPLGLLKKQTPSQIKQRNWAECAQHSDDDDFILFSR